MTFFGASFPVSLLTWREYGCLFLGLLLNVPALSSALEILFTAKKKQEIEDGKYYEVIGYKLTKNHMPAIGPLKIIHAFPGLF